MAVDGALKQQLRSLLGRRVVHRGSTCLVVEVLEQEPALVLESCHSGSALQDNQYGNPGRRVAETFTIPLFDEEYPDQIHPALQQLGIILPDD